MTSMLWGAFPPRDGAAPSILGEKEGSFFGGGSGCSYFDGSPSDDEDWCSPMVVLPGVSPPMLIKRMDEGLGHDVVFLVVAFLWCELPVS
jgi:hypothetical protein